MTSKYFDNATAARPSDYALKEYVEATSNWQCVSAPYERAPVRSLIEQKYASLQTLLGWRDTDKCFFTSCSNESIAQIFRGVYKESMLQYGKNQILHLSTDEAPILLAAEELAEFHMVPQFVDVKETGGVCTKELLRSSITPRTAIVSLSWGHGLTGIIHPIWELAELCEEEGVLLHIDATEMFGKMYFHFQDLPIDYLTLDGARLHAPYGTGLLISKRGSELPALFPDVLQQDGARGGVFNYPGFAALEAALRENASHADHMCVEMIRLRDLFESLIQEKLPSARIFFQENERLPHVSVVSFPGVHSEQMQFSLCHQGVYVSRGGGVHQAIDRVLESSGVEHSAACSALSFSFSYETTEDDIRSAVHLIEETYTRLEKGRVVTQ